MQDIVLAGYFKFKYTVTKIYHSCWIGMPTILVGLVCLPFLLDWYGYKNIPFLVDWYACGSFRLVARIAIGPFSKVPRLFGQTSGYIIGS